jgi:hypothetical protein
MAVSHSTETFDTVAKAGQQSTTGSVVDLDSITGGFVPVNRDIEVPEGVFDWIATLPPPVSFATAAGSEALPHFYNWLLESHAGWYRSKHPGQPVESMGVGFREAVEGETLVAWAGDLPAAPTVVDIPAVGPPTAVVGNTLTCTMGNWTGAPTSYAYRWLADGTTPVGTGATHLVTEADQGKSLTCVVTATNPIGTTEAGPSNAVAIAAAGGASAQSASAPRSTTPAPSTSSASSSSSSTPKHDDKK